MRQYLVEAGISISISGFSALWLATAAICAHGAVRGYRSGGIHEPFFLWMSALAVGALLVSLGSSFPPAF